MSWLLYYHFSPYPYTLQEDLSIYGQLTSSDEILSERTFFIININYNYFISPKNKSNDTIESLRKIINSNINIICYYSKDVVPYYLGSIPQKHFSLLTPLHVTM